MCIRAMRCILVSKLVSSLQKHYWFGHYNINNCVFSHLNCIDSVMIQGMYNYKYNPGLPNNKIIILCLCLRIDLRRASL